MKDFKYYSTVPVLYPDRNEYAKSLRDRINNNLMTAKQREDALANVDRDTAAWFLKQSLPYNAAQAALENEFWADCRKDLGYDELLTDDGCNALEGEAWNRGHSAGFSEVYGELMNLVALTQILAKNIKTPAKPVPMRTDSDLDDPDFQVFSK